MNKSSRVKRTTGLTLLFLMSLAAPALSQTNTAVSFDMPKSRNPISAYSPSGVPEPQLANSPLLTQLIRDGKLYVSPKDAIRLPLQNNHALTIASFHLTIATTDILRSQAGGIFRGVNTGVVQGTP